MCAVHRRSLVPFCVGALIAGMIAVRKPEELKDVFTPDIQRIISAFDESWGTVLYRFIRTGVLFSRDNWVSVFFPLCYYISSIDMNVERFRMGRLIKPFWIRVLGEQYFSFTL